MTINLDSEIVATRYDSATGECFYTIERGGKRWTARVHLDDLNKHGPVATAGSQRRNYLAGALEEAMRGPPDGETAISDISGAQPAQMLAMAPATVAWKPAWYSRAKQIALEYGWSLIENAQGYLSFVSEDGKHASPISFEGIDFGDKGAGYKANERLVAAAKEAGEDIGWIDLASGAHEEVAEYERAEAAKVAPEVPAASQAPHPQ